MNDQRTTEVAPARAASLRLRPGMMVGGVLAAAALATTVGLAVGPGSPPSIAEPGTAAPSAAATSSPSQAEQSTAAPQGSPPLHITYPVVGMDQDVQALTPTDSGSQSITPPMTTDAYWLTPYGSPGSTDTTYIIGHSWEGRDSAFNHLSSSAKPGDPIILSTAAGPVTYTVTTVSTEDKYTLKDSSIWDRIHNRLILISCYTADLHGTNIIVTADLSPGP